MSVQNSFIEFYPPAVAAARYKPHNSVALPLLPNDRLTVQAALRNVVFMVEDIADVRLGLCQRMQGSYSIIVPDFLPVEVQAGANRAWVNRHGTRTIVSGLTPGVYALGLYAGNIDEGFEIFGVSNPLLYAPYDVVLPVPITRVRYRNNVPAFGFDYWSPDFYHYLRLPLLLHSPVYDVQDVQSQDAEGRVLPVFARIQKYYTLSTDYLDALLAEALQLALKHSDFQVYDDRAAAWLRLAAVGALKLNWTGNPELPLCTATGRLQDAAFAAVNAPFVTL